MPILLLLVGCLVGACGQSSEAQSKSDKPAEAGKDGKPQVTDAKQVAKLIPEIQWVEAFPELTFKAPVALVTAPGDDEYLYIVEKFGKVRRFKNNKASKETEEFLDLAANMREGGPLGNEEGLLSLVFHPQFAKNQFFYVYYTVREVIEGARGKEIHRKSRIERYQVDKKERNKVDLKSATTILEFDEPYANHNGSTMLFGKDGYLYISIGDGGAAGDPHNAAQDLTTLLGKIIRIDVDKQDKGKEYATPSDNPFVREKRARGEVWAYGLRNVWRMSFDRKTGDLWAGDVGQNAWEEISLITKGGNYGWRVKEGFHDYLGREAKDGLVYLPPIVEHNRDEAKSITGGYVYRGKAHPSLTGIYFYGDYATHRVWGLLYADGKLKAHRELASPKISLSSFGEDQAGEIYALDYITRSKVLRLEAKPVDQKD